ncbi:hypothetical protein C1646_756142 [Rhizophagus diaphanus]|nr:hypothetical protein C1646_756142 [Rhizophagus diaphanus] [Rhizophagus sp. MUCL 43196]
MSPASPIWDHFNKLEHVAELIKILFQKLRPSFKLPSQKTLSTSLLDDIYDNTKDEVNELINSAYNI